VTRIHSNNLENYETQIIQLQTELGELKTQFNLCLKDLEDKNLMINNQERVITDHETFIYMVTHDIKGAITNILGLISLIEGSEIKGEVFELLPVFKKSIERVNESIKDISQLTILEGNQVILDEVDLDEVIDRVINHLEIENEITKEFFQIELQVKKVKALKKHIVSIVYNLVKNAIKYKSPDRRLKIKIRSYILSDEVVITVEDNGLGIQNEFIDDVFLKFQRFQKGQIEGSGLGLYIIKKIVNNLGGRIEVQSEYGKGSIFSVYLKGN